MNFSADETDRPTDHPLMAFRPPGEKGKYGDECILRLLQALDDHVPLPQRDTESPFLMPIDNVLTVKGRGTVLVGESG